MHLQRVSRGIILSNTQRSQLKHTLLSTVKPVLSGHSKNDKTKVFKTHDSLMKVENIAECSLDGFGRGGLSAAAVRVGHGLAIRVFADLFDFSPKA